MLRSRSCLEPPLLGWSRSQFFCWLEPSARAAFFIVASALAASFWQAKKESLVVVTKHDLRAIYIVKCDPKKLELKMKNVSVWSRSCLFLPGAGADPIWSELKPESAPGPQTSRVGATKKVEALQHWF